MIKDPSRRLGVSAAGIADIKRHLFFSNLDFDALLANRVKPPFIPRLVGQFLPNANYISINGDKC